MRHLLTLFLCVTWLTACGRGGNNVVLASLDRSDEIQLFCADLDIVTGNLFTLQALLPLAICDTDTVFAPEVQANFLGAVTQVQTGTVAAVSFTSSLIVDTNRTVPGVTTLRVGEQPTGIQISPFEPSYSYVSSFSPKSVQAVPTEAIITGFEFDVDEVRFDAGPTDIALHELAFARPLTNDEGQVIGAESSIVYRYVYVAIPELGQIAQIPVIVGDDDKHERLGTATFIDLGIYDCESVTPVAPPPSDETDYNRICPEDFEDRPGRFIKTVKTTATCVDGAAPGPAPVALALDRGLEVGAPGLSDDVLLVADANQPVIHRLSVGLDGATLLEPIVTGAPTSDVDVTPLVPASSDPDDRTATQRYLYAVSTADSSIITIDYAESSPTYGAVLPVLAGVSIRANEENVESRNRVRSAFSNVRSIEVISPEYDLEEDPSGATAPEVPEEALCDPNDGTAFALAQDEANLRGVFLAVSLSNGSMYFLDVYDLNAPCRGGEGAIACTLAETGPDQYASIRRHRRRFGFTPSSLVEIDGTPSLQFNTAPGQLDETNGVANASDGPGLEYINCPTSMSNVFGIAPNEQTDGLICASSQVWSSFTQRWDGRWEGFIVNSDGGLGLFSDESFSGESGNWFLAGDVPFCRVGVLGAQDGPGMTGIPGIDALDSYGGDRVLIVGDLPPNRRDDPDCDQFIDLRDDVDDFPVWFPILRAFNDELEIGPSPNPNRYTLEEVRYCFNQFAEYQIHTRNTYAVTGTTSGFIHRIVPDPITNECVFDEERPPEVDDVDTHLTARAFADVQFTNPLVSFQIGAFDDDVAITDSTVALLNFNILNQFTALLLDTGGVQFSLPASMLFSKERDQLFFVDFEAGVRRIVFSPLSIVQTFE